MEFDELLKSLGEFGFYQFRVVTISCVAMLTITTHFMCQVFYTLPVAHWCRVPGWDNCSTYWNRTEEDCDKEMLSVAIPLKYDKDNATTVYSQCSRFDVIIRESNDSRYEMIGDTSDTISCDDGWVYHTTDDQTSLITDFDLVCSRESLAEITYTIFFGGILFSCAIAGLIGDRIGRRTTFFVGSGISGTFGVLAAFSPTVWFYASCRFMIGFGQWLLTSGIIVIASEIVGPSWRVVMSVVIWTTASFGYIAVAGLAYVTSSWRHLQIVISLPYLMVLLFITIVPESPRWLLSRGRVKDAEKTLQKIASVNKKSLPLNFMMDWKIEEVSNEEKNQTFFRLFLVPGLRWRILNIMFNWFVLSLVYYGLSLNSTDMGVNAYLAFCLIGVVEMGACILAMPSLNILGRRLTLFGTMLPGGFACIAAIFIPPGPWKITLAMAGKFCVTLSFTSMYIVTVENFPTPMRAAGLGFGSLCSRTGGMLCPTVLLLGNFWEPLPLLIFGSSGLIAGFLAMFLPETRGKSMPQTVHEAVALGRNNKRLPIPDQDIGL